MHLKADYATIKALGLDQIKSYYVIACKHENKPEYVAIDHYSGGYPYWTTDIRKAEGYLLPHMLEGREIYALD